ncbi:hypothetical protein NC651_005022 [Populus alba x Populus x berolinensis]|nr:hypothetical protein NC651_005022 [Populus alba x Populus x berolinensis]
MNHHSLHMRSQGERIMAKASASFSLWMPTISSFSSSSSSSMQHPQCRSCTLASIDILSTQEKRSEYDVD